MGIFGHVLGYHSLTVLVGQVGDSYGPHIVAWIYGVTEFHIISKSGVNMTEPLTELVNRKRSKDRTHLDTPLPQTMLVSVAAGTHQYVCWVLADETFRVHQPRWVFPCTRINRFSLQLELVNFFVLIQISFNLDSIFNKYRYFMFSLATEKKNKPRRKNQLVFKCVLTN